MRLSTQLLCMVWVVSSWCYGTPLKPGGKSTDVSLTGTSIHSPTFIEPAESEEDKASGEEMDEGVAGDDGDEEDEEEEDSTDEPATEPTVDFDDNEDLDALAKGILGGNANKESVVPCFGTWWPSSGGYVYYYEDYGTGGGGGTTGGGGGEDYGDYSSPRKRGRKSRRRRRMRRNRTRRARTSKRTAKKKA